MTSEKKETKKFLVPVTWIVAAEIVVEAESEEEAMELASNVDLDCFMYILYYRRIPIAILFTTFFHLFSLFRNPYQKP